MMLALLATVLLPGSLAAQIRVSVVDSMVLSSYTIDSVGSVSVAVLHNGEILHARSYGYADRERGILASDTTVYRIASITKQFVGIMLLQLAEHRRLRVDDPVIKYVPELASYAKGTYSARRITLAQLATMSAGMASEPPQSETFNSGDVSHWMEKTIAAIQHLPLIAAPGGQHNYSNTSYSILALALTRAARQPFTKYIEENVIRPMGMEQTKFVLTSQMRERLAKGYHVNKDRSLDTLTAQRGHLGRGKNLPAGGLYSTIRDIAKLLAFETGHGPTRILTNDALQAALDGIIVADSDLNYGDGLFFSAMRDLKGSFVALGHRGALSGYQANAVFHRASGIGVVVLANQTDDSGVLRYQQLAENLLAALIQEGSAH